jgi:multidrug efflux system membrane fusion protein
MIRPTPRALGWLALALLAVGGCKNGDDKQGAKSGPRPAMVKLATVVQGEAPLKLDAVGQVEALESVELRAQVSGQITAVGFQEGQDVARGALLYRIDPRPFQAAVKQAEATLQRDQAQARQAAAQFQRYDSLFKDGGISRDEYERLKAGSAALAATVEADRAAVEAARLQLGFTEIRSPIAGRTGRRLATLGNLVRANDVNPLVVVHQVDPIALSFSVPEANLARIRRYHGQGALGVAAKPQGDDGPALTGKLDFLDNAVDPATGTIRLKARFANAGRRLWPGQFAQVTLTLAKQPDAILVPSEAVQAGQTGPFVLVVGSDLTAQARPVTVDRRLAGQTVIATGLQAGEQVVVDGHLQVVPGGPVKPVTDKPGTEKP